MEFDYVVVGGGICGVTCAETLAILEPTCKILLISASQLVKVATRFRQITKLLEEFDVEEQPFSWLGAKSENVQIIHDQVATLDPEQHFVTLRSGAVYRYSAVCICTGGKPMLIARDNPFVIGIRDTETVQDFQLRLANASRVVIVGNGGIATELVSEMEGVDIIWAVKDRTVSAAFVDGGAAEFFLKSWRARREAEKNGTADTKPSKRLKYTSAEGAAKPSTIHGSALGPDWAGNVLMKGKSETDSSLQIEYNCEVSQILTPDESSTTNADENSRRRWPVYVELTNGKIFGCDFVVSATGVTPSVNCLEGVIPLEGIASDGGAKVNERMESCVPDVFVAGDACTTSWNPASHWLQMRLWTQARQMGAYAAKCMVAKMKNEELHMDFAFELFAHATKFFDFKIVLLGLFNGQRLNGEYEILLRMTPGVEYVKAVIKDGRLQGAILIGETDLEETFENLILNGTDVSSYGEDLLNPDVDIEDYFD